MRKNNVLGMIFSNTHDDYLPSLTHARAMGSVPFGGRYRLIDFPLSNMVNAGISKVGIITKSNYQSLMDHIGSGKSWDLSRKTEGLFFLPPMTDDDKLYVGRITPLYGAYEFFRKSKEDYVLISDCHVVGNIDYDRFIETHIKTKADITICYKNGEAPAVADNLILALDENSRVTDLRVAECKQEVCNFGIGLVIIRRDLLNRLLEACISRNQTSFEMDILQKNVNHLVIKGYNVSEYISPIFSAESFFKANMALLDHSIRSALFNTSRPIYTKVRDAAPARYGLNSNVQNTLVADGSVIDGRLKNSIIFRDVRIGKNAIVENSVVMQGAIICENAHLTGTVLDKNVVIRDGRKLAGTEGFPVYVNKGLVV